MGKSCFSNMISGKTRIIRLDFLFSLKISLSLSFYKVRTIFKLCK